MRCSCFRLCYLTTMQAFRFYNAIVKPSPKLIPSDDTCNRWSPERIVATTHKQCYQISPLIRPPRFA